MHHSADESVREVNEKPMSKGANIAISKVLCNASGLTLSCHSFCVMRSGRQMLVITNSDTKSEMQMLTKREFMSLTVS
jgi:hypothetical protein